MQERYNAHPIHLYTYALPLLLLGAICWAEAVYVLGVVLFLMGVGTVGWVFYNGYLNDRNDYLEQVTNHMLKLDRIKDPDVWFAAGFTKPKAFVPQYISHSREHIAPNTAPQISFPAPPVSVPKMQVFSDAALLGDSMAEANWGGKYKPMSLRETRRLKTFLENNGYIKLRNAETPTLGFEPTVPRGHEYFMHFASEGTKLMLEKRQIDTGTHQLLEGV